MGVIGHEFSVGSSPLGVVPACGFPRVLVPVPVIKGAGALITGTILAGVVCACATLLAVFAKVDGQSVLTLLTGIGASAIGGTLGVTIPSHATSSDVGSPPPLLPAPPPPVTAKE